MKLRDLFSKKSKSSSNKDSQAESFDKAPLGADVLHEGEGEIVAEQVHHLPSTWFKGPICWPRDFLKNDIPNARIITWGYDAGVANALRYSSKESIFGHSETLLSDIERLRRDKTDYANIIANVAKVSFRQPNKQLVGILSPDSDVLENQREQFTTITERTPIVCIREELPTAIGMFSSPQDIGYRRISSHIGSLVQASEASKNKEILKALRFETIDGREETIEDAHARTFDWILSDREHHSTEEEDSSTEEENTSTEKEDSSTNEENSSTKKEDSSTKEEDSSSIVPWLSKDDNPICWVSGKAGSGKSTLMKYIWTDERTRTHLSTWACGKPLVLAAFFFYERGESLQKSREGLIRSLLYQILSQQRWLIPIVFKSEFADVRILRQKLNWPNLKFFFETLLTQTSNLFKLCIFADGLDEYKSMDRMGDYTDDDFDLFYDGENDNDAVWGRSHWISNGHEEIAKLFKLAAKTTNIKLCLSSRELAPFQRAFEDFPRLRLHDLTAMESLNTRKTTFLII
ncbi:hypothetical protein V502_10280 [Pseudogymnoascus sp. VKM F-4520 (FW-2644)]|nr:hypothetical protein V502_10280 [Pseudogymnoascus sp. VKM F-4520 (FW-2644)]